jgi:2-dehydropantoate 2-reductase
MEKQFTYAVVGSGAIGSYYGAKLARHGLDVRFLMRSDLETVKNRGLELVEETGLTHLPKPQAVGTPQEIGPVDVVLIGIKATANQALESLIPPLLKESTVLVTLQNGLGNEEFLAERYGAHRVLGGLCFICLNRIAPGVIRHIGTGTLSIGEFNRPPENRTRQIVSDFRASGVEARAVESLVLERWRKLVWNIPFNGLSIAAGNIPTSAILADEGLRELARELMEETLEAAGALGHFIPASFIEDQFARTYPMGDYQPSSLLDHVAGRPVEVEPIWGEPHRQAQKAGVNMIRTQMLYRLLKSLTQ